MKKDQVQIGGAYVAKVSGTLATVRIDAESRFGGWEATNVDTGRKVRIKSAQRLRRAIGPKAQVGPARVETNDVEPAAVETAAVKDDAPPHDIDERLAAAPPSIVPYEQRRSRAEAAGVKPAAIEPATSAASTLPPYVDPLDVARRETAAVLQLPAYDPDRCATPQCEGTPAMTYLDRPLCQACWKRHCDEEQSSEVSENEFRENAGDACRPTEEAQTPDEENAVSKKTTTKKPSSQKQSKAQPAVAKAKGEKKAAAPKAPHKAAAPKSKASKERKPAGEPKPKRVSALDAAATVLQKAGAPMRCTELVVAMAEQGLWQSPNGKTPHATLYSAILREIGAKGSESRFRKVERGQFEFNG